MRKSYILNITDDVAIEVTEVQFYKVLNKLKDNKHEIKTDTVECSNFSYDVYSTEEEYFGTVFYM